MSLIVEFLRDNEGKTYQEILDMVEKPLVSMVMIKCRGNITRSAKELGIDRNTMYKKLKKYGMIK